MSPKYVIGEAPPGHGGREEGTLNIYAPDGHLWDGGLKDMWDCTEMPMPNGRIKYMQLDQSVLRNANYPRNKVDRVNLIVRRPHNIPPQ